ncbi:MAG: hypothetical protein JKP98_16420 [Rhodobacteraceae bacterium]|jgi:hypothetical protein|nr:MAG: hypothetical protein N838_29990 [Thiohalocapsa sp. PB-PSB1]MBL4543563.1 hypothetical protein [Paracoccaceae bacterium]MBL4558099.1 hypothetical protein [Paracoccaceae bacterium]HBG97702.1 hypothetical protein [Paracoccaceae bacterium]
MALMETLQDAIDCLAKAPNDKRRHIMRAMARQLRPCFDAFCWEHKLHGQWRLYVKAEYAYLDGSERELLEGIEAIFENYVDQLDEMELPSFAALSLAGYLVQSGGAAFDDALGAFFHEAGFWNSCIFHGSRDFDWIDPSIPLQPKVGQFLLHYFEFLDNKLTEEELLAASEAYDVRWMYMDLPENTA